MVPLPIVERELRVAARKRGTYFLRCASVLVAGIVTAWFLLSQDVPWQQSGGELFQRIAWVAFWAAMSAGAFTTADCLSSEKRQGTLGLLFLTNLRGYEVVLGKLVATSLNASYALVAVLPMLALPILMGGVDLADVTLVAGVLAVTLFVSLTVGLLVSALSTTEFEAILGTVLALVGICVLPRLLATLLEMVPSVPGPFSLSLSQVVGALNPFVLMQIVLNGNMAIYLPLVLLMFVLITALSVGVLLLASFIVRRSFRDGYGDMTEPLQKLWRRCRNSFSRQPAAASSAPAPRRSVSEAFQAYRRELLDVNPMLWLVNREPLRVKYMWFILGVFVLVWLVGFVCAPRLWLDWETTAFFAFFLNGSLKLLLAAEAPRQLAEDRKSGSLELILSTPLAERDVLSGYAQAIQRQFAKPIALVIVAEFLLLWLGHIYQVKANAAVATAVLASMILLVSDSVTLTTLGIWNGLRSQVPSRAAWRGVFWVLIFPWLIAYPTVLWLTSHVRTAHHYFGYTYYGSRPRFPEMKAEFLWFAWLLLMLAYNFFLIFRAKYRLQDSFRKLVAESQGSA